MGSHHERTHSPCESSPRVLGGWLASAVLYAALLLTPGCEPYPPRTVVLSGAGNPETPAVASPGAPAASASTGAASQAQSPAVASAEAPSGPAPAGSVSGGAAPAADAEDGAALLAARPLVIPVAGIAPSALVDTYEQPRSGGRHEAIDIVAPRGTPVHAVDDGKLVKLFTSVPGGLTVYQFDPEGRLAYYYAHLDRYADGLKEGMVLRRGDLVGYVGATGNAGPTPHLHFAVLRLGPERQWWKGDPVNPYPALRRARAVG
jgi:peptidoglycan LD-endopeptidase LytH